VNISRLPGIKCIVDDNIKWMTVAAEAFSIGRVKVAAVHSLNKRSPVSCSRARIYQSIDHVYKMITFYYFLTSQKGRLCQRSHRWLHTLWTISFCTFRYV